MSVYSLSDPRTGKVRYVGQSKRPAERFKNHLIASHSPGINKWCLELSSEGLAPAFAILGQGTESEWIEKLKPDLNVHRGSGHSAPEDRDEVAATFRLPRSLYAEIVRMAKDEDRPINTFVMRALRARVENAGKTTRLGLSEPPPAKRGK